MSGDPVKLEIDTHSQGDIMIVEPRGRATLGENSEALDHELQRLAGGRMEENA